MVFTPLNALINGFEESWSVFIDFRNSRECVKALVRDLFFTSSESIDADALFMAQPTVCTPIRLIDSEKSFVKLCNFENNWVCFSFFLKFHKIHGI